MRIVSRFDDYYDGVRSIDRDPEPLYVRETGSHDLQIGDRAQRDALRTRVGRLWSDQTVPPAVDVDGAERAVIGFCGQAWPCYRYRGQVAFDVDALIELARPHIDKHDLAELMATSASAWSRGLNRATWARFVATARLDVGDDPFIAFNAPIVVVTDATVDVNPRLQPWGFASRRDPFSAWQALSVFLGNNLAAQRVVAPRPIDDTIKAHAHGFDRQSFRNTRNRPKGSRNDW